MFPADPKVRVHEPEYQSSHPGVTAALTGLMSPPTQPAGEPGTGPPDKQLSPAAGFLLGGGTYGAVVVAGATGTSTTYYACLTTTKTLTKVGTVAPN